MPVDSSQFRARLFLCQTTNVSSHPTLVFGFLTAYLASEELNQVSGPVLDEINSAETDILTALFRVLVLSSSLSKDVTNGKLKQELWKAVCCKYSILSFDTTIAFSVDEDAAVCF